MDRKKVEKIIEKERRRNRVPSFKNMDLTGTNFNGADLREVVLSGADLSASDLMGAELTGTILLYADLSKVNLSGANLTGANLNGADLTYADLSGACLHNSNLHGANLNTAYLVGADFRGADIDYASWPLWRGSVNVTVDTRIAAQFAAHGAVLNVVRQAADTDEIWQLVVAWQAACLALGKHSHRANDLGLGE